MSKSNREWLNSNSLRAYPLRDTYKQSSDEGVPLPPTFLLDAIVAAPSELTDLALTAIYRSDPVIVVQFRFNDSTLCSATITDTASHKSGDAYDIVTQGDYKDIVQGRIVLGELTNVLSGSFNIPLELTCVIPSLTGVTGLNVIDGDVTSKYMTGLVSLVAGRNVQIVVQNDNEIRIDALETQLVSDDCPCSDAWTHTDPLLSINGVYPDESGNINLTSLSECLEIGVEDETITLTDACSEPCCGCQELEAIVGASELLKNNIEVLRTQLEQLTTQQINYQQIVTAGG